MQAFSNLVYVISGNVVLDAHNVVPMLDIEILSAELEHGLET
jgi:hypothetical protein